MRFNSFATFPHYQDHMQPVLDRLRELGHEVQSFTGRHEVEWADSIHPALTIRHPCDAWLVAGKMDYDKVPGRVVYFEHGAGQAYEADERTVGHPSYSAGRLDRVALYLCPNLFVYHRRRRTHPEAVARLVGMPRMDRWHMHASGAHEGVRSDVVAFSWHWHTELIPETTSAFPDYQAEGGLRRLALGLRRRGITPVTTAHPRIMKRVAYHAERSGFEVWDSDAVLDQAAVLVADNTSLMYEFCSLDRPLVVINASGYRKDVHHGLRFWEAIPGEQVDAPADPIPAIERAFEDSDHWREVRSTINAYVCPVRDGRAAERAASAIVDLVR